jgi:Icc-related predicted phosphoesterase
VGLFARKPREHGTRLFFATDVHGSDRCFRKFLNAARTYDVSYLVLGGDITGKMVVPIWKDRTGGYSCQYGDAGHTGLDQQGVAELKKVIRGFGHYYVVVDDPAELERLGDPAHQEAVFRRVVRDSVAEWIALAEERLRGSGIRCFMAPGNDDFFDIDSAIEGSDVVEYVEGRRVRLDEDHEMITTGYSNPTPWNTERELPEPDLRARIDGMAADVADPGNLVAVLHPPPYRSSLDDAPALDETLGMKLSGAGVVMTPVGSTAVRGFIEDAQPLLALHGHVHEGGGATQIGRTLCLNPGSAYTAGVLNGAIVVLGPDRVISHQFVSG